MCFYFTLDRIHNSIANYLVHYFKLVSEGYTFRFGETYLRQEAPKGELGS